VAAESLASRLRAKHSEMMAAELESVAVRLFEQHGFAEVTVEDIASEAQISARTFYRYFPSKEDVLQPQIDRRCAGLERALALRPTDEPALHSLRIAYAEQVAAEDPDFLRRWIGVITATPSLVPGVIGGILMKTQLVISGFFATRLDQPNDSLIPTMLSAAVFGVIQAAQTQWFFHGGDLATIISESLHVLETGMGADPETWRAAAQPGTAPDARTTRRTVRKRSRSSPRP